MMGASRLARLRRRFLLLLLLTEWSALATTGRLPTPREKVILTIRGAIEHHNQGSSAVFDLAMLEALPQHQFVTRTPWDSGPVSFSGPLLRDVLRMVGARGRKLRAIALNDYQITIPISDAKHYNVILALRKNGSLMSVRQKGPVFIIYPFDSEPHLHNRRYYERSVWQLTTLEVE